MSEIIQPITIDEFRELLAQLWKSQREDLERIAGYPVNPSRVPKDFWKKQEEERRAVLAVLLAGMALSFYSSDMLALLESDSAASSAMVRRSVQNYSKTRARTVSRLMGRTSVSRANEFGYDDDEELFADYDEGDDLAEFIADRDVSFLDRVYGDDRRESVVENELAAARSISRQSVSDEADRRGVDYWHIWNVSATCDHCDLCLLLDGTDESFWGRFVLSPPIHPHCCCSTSLHFGVSRSAMVQNELMLRRAPSARDVRRGLQSHGYRNVWR